MGSMRAENISIADEADGARIVKELNRQKISANTYTQNEILSDLVRRPVSLLMRAATWTSPFPEHKSY